MSSNIDFLRNQKKLLDVIKKKQLKAVKPIKAIKNKFKNVKGKKIVKVDADKKKTNISISIAIDNSKKQGKRTIKGTAPKIYPQNQNFSYHQALPSTITAPPPVSSPLNFATPASPYSAPPYSSPFPNSSTPPVLSPPYFNIPSNSKPNLNESPKKYKDPDYEIPVFATPVKEEYKPQGINLGELQQAIQLSHHRRRRTKAEVEIAKENIRNKIIADFDETIPNNIYDNELRLEAYYKKL